MKVEVVIALAAVLIGPVALHAGEAHRHDAPAVKKVTPDSQKKAASAPSEGEVRRIDHDGKKITLRHGPITNLDMPPMTMVFQVADPAMLDAVKPGDKVTFEAEKVGSAYRLTRIVPAPTPK
jgi:Cu(I)/Ag(I) efflux system protein CusF